MSLAHISATSETLKDRPDALSGIEGQVNTALAGLLTNNILRVQVATQDSQRRSGRDINVSIAYDDAVGTGVLATPYILSTFTGRTLAEAAAQVAAFQVANPAAFVAALHFQVLGQDFDSADPFIVFLFYSLDGVNGPLNWRCDGSTTAGPVGPAGGDLAGVFPNPTVDGIQGVSVAAAPAAGGQMLVYDTPSNSLLWYVIPTYATLLLAAADQANQIIGAQVNIYDPASQTGEEGRYRLSAKTGVVGDYTKISDQVNTAGEVDVVDAGSLFYTAVKTVESVLQEIGYQSEISVRRAAIGGVTLADLVTAIGATDRTILVDETDTLAADLVIPENITLRFTRDGFIDGAFDLTINGPLVAGEWQLFSNDVTVLGSPKIEFAVPQWFGDVGTADDKAVLQAVLDTGFDVRLPGGVTYTVLTQLVVSTAGQRITGDGDSTVLYMPTAANNLLRIESDDVEVSNIRFRPPPSTTSLSNGIAVFVIGADSAYIHDCSFDMDSGGTTHGRGIVLDHANRCRVLYNAFLPSGTLATATQDDGGGMVDIHYDGSDNIIQFNTITGPVIYGIGIVLDDGLNNKHCDRNLIGNNTIYFIRAHGIALYVANVGVGVGNSLDSNVISFNTVNTCDGSAEDLGGNHIYGISIYIQTSTNTVVAFNTVKNSAEFSTGVLLPVSAIGGTVAEGLIIGNIIEDSFRRAMYFSNVVGNSRPEAVLKIINNMVFGTGVGYDGVYITGAPNCQMSGNSFAGTGTYAIRKVGDGSTIDKFLLVSDTIIADDCVAGITVEDVDNCIVSRIQVAGTTGGGGISITNNVSYAEVLDCELVGVTGTAIDWSDPTTIEGMISRCTIVSPSTYGIRKVPSIRDRDNKIISPGTADYNGNGVWIALDNTGTPSVKNHGYFLTGGTAAITDFDDGYEGQEITVISVHTVSVMPDGAKIVLGGNIPFRMENNDTLTLVQRNGIWHETGREVRITGALTTTNRGVGTHVLGTSVTVDKQRSAEWFVSLSDNAGNVEHVTVLAQHNGTTGADATVADYTISGPGPTGTVTAVLSVDLNGAGTAQVMRLILTVSAGLWSVAGSRRTTDVI